ncbi:hypothetical protein H4582DRAFT_1810761 [Lactarius indigo]|nr:hypothetical protein H4582DRAFT_1810761 [Lactarius indigo]
MSHISEPLKKQRLVALALCWVWSVVASCVGLNALIKFVHCRTPMSPISHSMSLGPTRPRHISGSSLPPASLLNFISMVPTSLLGRHLRLVLSPCTDIYQSGVWPARSTGSLKIQAWILTFFSAWILATQIPYTIFTANHHAKVDGFLNGVQIPPATFQAALVAEGLSDKYSKLHHAVLLAIFPWIALLFNAILVVILFAAARRR